jgi:hypothetical protein
MSLALDRTGSVIAAAADNGRTTTWEAASRRFLHTFGLQQPFSLLYTSRFWETAPSP